MRSYSSISSHRCGIMGKTRALALLLCLALCLGGCVNRPAPAPVPTAAPTEIPAAPTAEPIPVAPADPTATPVPTPTPGGDPTPAPPAEACAHPEWVKDAHDLGMSVNVWTVNKEEDIRAMIDCGVDCITTNEPELVRQILGERELRN